MTMTARRNEPCTATVTPGQDGGLTLTLTVPCYGGDETFYLKAERSPDGDWMVFIPWPSKIETREHGMVRPDGTFLLAAPDGSGYYEGGNGILYLGAPDDSLIPPPENLHDGWYVWDYGGGLVSGPHRTEEKADDDSDGRYNQWVGQVTAGVRDESNWKGSPE